MRFVGGILTPPVAHAKELYIDQKNDVTKRNCTLSKPLSSHNLLKPKPRLRLGKVTKHDYALTKNTKMTTCEKQPRMSGYKTGSMQMFKHVRIRLI